MSQAKLWIEKQEETARGSADTATRNNEAIPAEAIRGENRFHVGNTIRPIDEDARSIASWHSWDTE